MSTQITAIPSNEGILKESNRLPWAFSWFIVRCLVRTLLGVLLAPLLIVVALMHAVARFP